MKKLLLILILTISISAFAQEKVRKERIQALKIAFITERLDLTQQEAQQFWPVYNSFEDEKEKLRNESQQKRRGIEFETLTDSEAKKLVKDMLTIEEKKHNLQKKHINALLEVLPAKKVILLKATEDSFNKRMMEQFKKRREGFRKNKP